MKHIKTITLLFLIVGTPIFSQKSRLGETAKLSLKVNLISFNDSIDINYENLLKYKKPIALFFWQSTCGPCIKELNAVQGTSILKKLKNKAKIIVVSNDRPINYQKARQIAKMNHWKFDLFFDKKNRLRNSLLNNWYGVPQVMILDKNKEIVLHKFGYRQGEEHKIVNKLKELIHYQTRFHSK